VSALRQLNQLGLWALLVLVLLSPPARAQVAWLADVERQAADNPVATLAALQSGTLGQGIDPFWQHLARARVAISWELAADTTEQLNQAELALPKGVPPHDPRRLWLAVTRHFAQRMEGDLKPSVHEMDRLASDIEAAHDPYLACNHTSHLAEMLADVDELNRTWQAVEKLELCAQAVRSPALQALALSYMGTLSGSLDVGAANIGMNNYYERALRVLGPEGPRAMRSAVHWELGRTLVSVMRLEEAVRNLEQARALSQQIGDSTSVAVIEGDLGKAWLLNGEPKLALELARHAATELERTGHRTRLTSVHAVIISAMARLRMPDVMAMVQKARKNLQTDAVPAVEGRLRQAVAEALASRGQFEAAYEELVKAQALTKAGQSEAMQKRMLALQARYDASQRQAEINGLRLKDESSRLALQAKESSQRALWVAVSALAVMFVAASTLMVQAVRRRRQLSDLALRDELTGQPNRRAILTYAQAQWQQANKLRTPLTVALLDLDFFKQINDTWGHAVGDEVLRCFARASEGNLRTHDRLGRYGGEEWLLVLPGESADSARMVFERLARDFSRTAIDGMPRPHGRTFSMGVAELSADTPTLDSMIAAADQALYHAKHHGRNQVQVAGQLTVPDPADNPHHEACVGTLATEAPLADQAVPSI